MELLGSENKVLKNQLNESRHRESVLNSTINDTGGKSMSLPNQSTYYHNFSHILDTNRTYKNESSIDDQIIEKNQINNINNNSTYTELG